MAPILEVMQEVYLRAATSLTFKGRAMPPIDMPKWADNITAQFFKTRGLPRCLWGGIGTRILCIYSVASPGYGRISRKKPMNIFSILT